MPLILPNSAYTSNVRADRSCRSSIPKRIPVMTSAPIRAITPTDTERVWGRRRRAAGPRFCRRSSLAARVIRAHQMIGPRGTRVSPPRPAARCTSRPRRRRLRRVPGRKSSCSRNAATCPATTTSSAREEVAATSMPDLSRLNSLFTLALNVRSVQSHGARLSRCS